MSILGGFGWLYAKRVEKVRERELHIRKVEEKLREERLTIYDALLEPFILALTKPEGLEGDKRFKGMTPSEAGQKLITDIKSKIYFIVFTRPKVLIREEFHVSRLLRACNRANRSARVSLGG